MRDGVPWSRALLISCIVHCLVLAVLWWAGAFSASPATAERFIEMDLVNDTAARETADINATVARATTAAVPGKAEEAESDFSAPVSTIATVSDGSPTIAGANPARGPIPAGMVAASGKKVESTGGKLIPPRILQKVEPVYPEEMCRQGAAGTVVLRIEVLENGFAANVSVQRSSGFADLDEAALQATRQWRFVPAKDEATGAPVRCYTTLPVVFRLN